MSDKKEHDGRGGKRKGAGRPKTDSKIYSFRVPGNIAQHIEEKENKTEFIKSCIVKALYEEQEQNLSQLGEISPITTFKEINLPYFDQGLVAGFPIPLDNDERAQDIELLHMLCPHPESCYLIRIVGDSMIDAGINSGDIVIVDKSNRNPSPTEVAVCELNGEYTLKHFVLRDNSGWLVPDNPEFPEIPIQPNDDFSVWGTVTYVIHKTTNKK